METLISLINWLLALGVVYLVVGGVLVIVIFLFTISMFVKVLKEW